MLCIRKRNGTTEPFDIEKIKNALAAASDEVGQPMPDSQLGSITRELEEMFAGRSEASSQQLYVALVGILFTRGNWDVLRRYMLYADNAFRR